MKNLHQFGMTQSAFKECIFDVAAHTAQTGRKVKATPQGGGLPSLAQHAAPELVFAIQP